MNLIGDPRLIVVNSKIRRNHTIGPGNLTGWQPPPPAKSEEEHQESEDAWARFKEALAAAILAADEDAIREADFPNWCDYWGAALAWDMPVTDFVFLIETHALTPERTAKEIKGTAVPFAMFLMKGLDEALQSREPWIYGETKAAKCRVRPREAAMWLNRRLSGQARLPDTLRAFLDGPDVQPVRGTGGPGRPSSMHLVQAEAKRRLEHEESEKTVKAESVYLNTWFKKNHPGLQAPTAKTIENKTRDQYRATIKPRK